MLRTPADIMTHTRQEGVLFSPQEPWHPVSGTHLSGGGLLSAGLTCVMVASCQRDSPVRWWHPVSGTHLCTGVSLPGCPRSLPSLPLHTCRQSSSPSSWSTRPASSAGCSSLHSSGTSVAPVWLFLFSASRCPFLFISVQLSPSLFISVQLCPSLFISVQLCFYLSNSVHPCSYLSIPVYICPSLSIPIYICPSLFISVHP